MFYLHHNTCFDLLICESTYSEAAFRRLMPYLDDKVLFDIIDTIMVSRTTVEPQPADDQTLYQDFYTVLKRDYGIDIDIMPDVVDATYRMELKSHVIFFTHTIIDDNNLFCINQSHYLGHAFQRLVSEIDLDSVQRIISRYEPTSSCENYLPQSKILQQQVPFNYFACS